MFPDVEFHQYHKNYKKKEKRSQRDLVNSHVHLCGCQDPIKSYIDPGYDKS